MGRKKDPSIEQLKEIFGEADPKLLQAFEITMDAAVKRAAEIGAEKGAEVGAKSVLDAVEGERRKWRSENYRRRYANTRLLLQHYRSLNEHFAGAVWESGEDEADEFYDIMELMSGRSMSDTVIVESIKKSSEKTRIIMRHVNKMLDEYKAMCEKSCYVEDGRQWRVIRDLYLSPTKIAAEVIAEREHIHKRTVYKDVDAAIEDLTLLLFGVDGIEKLCE